MQNILNACDNCELIPSSKRYCKYMLLWNSMSSIFSIYCNIAYQHITYYICRWYRCLLMKELTIFKQNLWYTAKHIFFFFLDPQLWLEIHPSVTFLGIGKFFSKTCYGISDHVRLCVTKPKFLVKISFGHKQSTMVKMTPKQGFLDFLRKLYYFCLA